MGRRLYVGNLAWTVTDHDEQILRTLGVFLLIASQNPDANKSIIWFTVWSSVVHGVLMAVQSFYDVEERGHLIGDVPALILIAIILAVLMPRAARA